MSEIALQTGWLLARAAAGAPQGWQALDDCFQTGRNVLPLSAFPMQVHDVLIQAGEIENPNIRGVNHDLWIHDLDWIYRCDFSARPEPEAALCLDGLDTFADVWLNGRLLGRTDDVYLTWRFDVTGLLREENRLILHFHAAKPLVEAADPGETYRNAVPAISALRVFRTGYHDYCGPSPCLIRCGPYAPVRLLSAEPVALADASVAVKYDPDTGVGRVAAELDWLGRTEARTGTLTLGDGAGRTVAETAFALQRAQKVDLSVASPALWYPWTHGTPAVYTLRLQAAGMERTWTVGFRTVQVGDGLAFSVNGRPFRPWGANLMHLDTRSGCHDAEKMERLLDLAMLANCNMLRIWGEAERLPQAFYDSCDRRGILLWQDFFLGCSLYPEDADYAAAVAREGEQLVRACRHHPSLALWCGGNELYLARDYQHPDAPVYGEKLVTETLAVVCRRLDPDRFYLANSPSGGRWANDPLGGDTHGYTHLWFVPGRQYPVFLSENCRVSPPTLRSLRRMMPPEELWPTGYRGGLTRTNPYEWPETWNRHAPSEGWKKLGPVEHYRDAETPEELVYRAGMAHAEYIHIQMGRFRRGRAGAAGVRRTNGHLLWRLNDNSNVISFGVVDYFLEPGPAFYELKRCYQPLYVSCELADSARVWFVNDTPSAFRGRLEVSLFHLTENRRTAEKTLDFAMEPDASGVLCTLDDFGQFRKENIVCLQVWDEAGALVCRGFQPCDIERRLPYPEDSGLALTPAPGGVVLTCARFAHAVELEGEADGDTFGWVFADNWFDLLPGEARFVPILRGKPGRIRARAACDRQAAECAWGGA